ncbi:MAG: VWA domain-containing protein [Gammaproteobacteria bacterium]
MSDALMPLVHFVRPAWLLALPIALLLAWRWHRRVRARSRWVGQVDPALLSALMEPGRNTRAHAVPWLVGAGLAAAAVGLAGPSFERLPQPVESSSDAVVVVLDLSLSMLAEDVKPSRLVRARQKVADLLRLRPEGTTALIVYAGNAHTVVPLTTDSRTIENLLPALTPTMMPVFGSELGEAIDLARALLANAGRTAGLIIAVTDGIDREADVTERRDPRFPVAVLGVGTAAGGSIPLGTAGRPDQVLRTQQGETIIARLDPERMEAVARAMHGRYATLGIDDGDVRALLDTPRADANDTRAVDRTFDLWADRGYWLALALLPLLLLGFRRGVLASLALLLVPPPPATASVWDDLWQRPDQQAYQHLIEGSPERAAREFENREWRAAALYRAGEHARAAELWSTPAPPDAPPSPAEPRSPEAQAPQRTTEGEGDTATRAYNRGNALAQAGRYADAVQAYDAALAAAPDDADARFNRDLVSRILEQQAEDQRRKDPGQDGAEGEQQQGQGDTNEDPTAQSGTQHTDPEQQAPEDPNRTDAEQADGEQSPEARAMTENAEQRTDPDALEQWLRRVPDDPAGLLRRKFQHETNQRLRRGEYRARDPEKIW